MLHRGADVVAGAVMEPQPALRKAAQKGLKATSDAGFGIAPNAAAAGAQNTFKNKRFVKSPKSKGKPTKR